nr:MAG: capsid protein [Cressdnaviricota sp.]
MKYYKKKTTKRFYKKGGKKHTKAKKQTYPDKHNFKFVYSSSMISSAGGKGTVSGMPIGTGQVVLNSTPIQGPSPNALFYTTGVFNFNLIKLPQFTQYCAYFDRFRLNSITIRCIPTVNISSPQGPEAISSMRFIKDYDDIVIPPNVGWVYARRGVTKRLTKPFTMKLIPKVGAPVVINGTTIPNAYINKSSWQNCATAQNNTYYGIKFALRDFLGTSSNNNIIRFEITYNVSFKEQLNPNAVDNQAMFGIPPGAVYPTTYITVDENGNEYDQDGNLVAAPDADGNEIPV